MGLGGCISLDASSVPQKIILSLSARVQLRAGTGQRGAGCSTGNSRTLGMCCGSRGTTPVPEGARLHWWHWAAPVSHGSRDTDSTLVTECPTLL